MHASHPDLKARTTLTKTVTRRFGAHIWTASSPTCFAASLVLLRLPLGSESASMPGARPDVLPSPGLLLRVEGRQSLLTRPDYPSRRYRLFSAFTLLSSACNVLSVSSGMCSGHFILSTTSAPRSCGRGATPARSGLRFCHRNPSPISSLSSCLRASHAGLLSRHGLCVAPNP